MPRLKLRTIVGHGLAAICHISNRPNSHVCIPASAPPKIHASTVVFYPFSPICIDISFDIYQVAGVCIREGLNGRRCCARRHNRCGQHQGHHGCQNSLLQFPKLSSLVFIARMSGTRSNSVSIPQQSPYLRKQLILGKAGREL